MKTISAKELRNNLDKIVLQVRAGEQFRVTYRSKRALIITADQPASDQPAPGSHEAVERFLQRVAERKRRRGAPVFDPDKSIKQLYHEMLDNDPKYRPPYHR